jgi:hypothetical protein
MTTTSAKDGAIADVSQDGGGSAAMTGTGGMSTGIGNGAANSGFPLIQTATAADFAAARIGGGSASPAGVSIPNTLGAPTITAGSGYTNGTYLLNAANGGLTGGTGDLNGEIQVTVAGGAITAASVTKVGRYITAPTAVLTALGGGSAGVVTPTLLADGRVNALGTGYGTNKGTRYLVAAGSVANGAAVSGGYLNRSGRTMATGDATWAVAP